MSSALEPAQGGFRAQDLTLSGVNQIPNRNEVICFKGEWQRIHSPKLKLRSTRRPGRAFVKCRGHDSMCLPLPFPNNGNKGCGTSSTAPDENLWTHFLSSQ